MIKENVKLAYGLAAVLLVVGIICYAVDSEPRPEEPVRIVFTNVAGNILFDHQEHIGYERDCFTCHHHGNDSSFMSCVTCHQESPPETVPSVCNDCHPIMADSYSYEEHHWLLEDDPGAWSCRDCHQIPEGESIPYACGDCHDPYDPFFIEAAEMIEMTYEQKEDAFHGQCAGCHEDYGVGPVLDDCTMCHVR